MFTQVIEPPQLTASEREEFKMQTRGIAIAADHLYAINLEESARELVRLVVKRQEFLRQSDTN